LVGPFGGHRFYLGQTGWGLFFLFTAGFFLIGWVIDLFMIPAYVQSYNRRVEFLREEAAGGVEPPIDPAPGLADGAFGR
jgi:hypothetical protein